MTEKIALTIDDAAERLGVSRRMIYRMLETKELTAIKIGRSTRILLADIQSYLDNAPRFGS